MGMDDDAENAKGANDGGLKWGVNDLHCFRLSRLLVPDSKDQYTGLHCTCLDGFLARFANSTTTSLQRFVTKKWNGIRLTPFADYHTFD